MCSGECVSTTTSVDGKMQRQCSCCSASKTVKREIDAKCEDGTVRKVTVELVEECECGATKCAEKPEAQIGAKPQPEEPKKEKKQKKKGRRGLFNKAKKWLGF